MIMAMPHFNLVSRPVEPMSPSGGPIAKFDDPNKSLSFFGYMDFPRMSDFTDFVNDIEFIEAYLDYRRIMKFIMGGSKAHMKALSWLYLYTEVDGSRLFTDVDGDQERDDHPIPSSISAVWEKYGEDESKKSEFIGCLLFLTDEKFQRAASRYENGNSDPPSKDKIANTYAALERIAGFFIHITHQRKSITRKGHPLPEGLRSERTQKHEEHVCERWNRIWHCFRMMEYYKTHRQEPMFATGQDEPLSTFGPFWWEMNATKRAEYSQRASLSNLRDAMSRIYGEVEGEKEEEEEDIGGGQRPDNSGEEEYIANDSDDDNWGEEQFMEGYDMYGDKDEDYDEDSSEDEELTASEYEKIYGYPG